MQPLAVVSTEWRRKRAMRPATNHQRRGFWAWPHPLNISLLASQMLAESDAKDSRRDSYAIPWRILKPNIYYKPYNFAQRVVATQAARVSLPWGCGEEGERGNLEVNTPPGPMAMSRLAEDR
jgi:hypothetical protein